MGNHTRAKPGGYGPNAPILHTEIDKIDDQHAKSPNFDEGSNHTPTADIELTGPNGIKLMGTHRLLYESRSVVRVQPSVWDFSAGGLFAMAGGFLTQTALGGAYAYFQLANIPDGATLTAVALRVDGAGSHAADPIPGSIVPKLQIEKVAYATGTVTAIGSEVTDTTDRTAFEAPHDLAVTGLTETIDLATYFYRARFDSERAGGQAGLQVFAAKVTCTLSNQPEF